MEFQISQPDRIAPGQRIWVSPAVVVTQVAPDFQAILLLRSPLCNQLKKIFLKNFLARIFPRQERIWNLERKNFCDLPEGIFLGPRKQNSELVPQGVVFSPGSFEKS